MLASYHCLFLFREQERCFVEANLVTFLKLIQSFFGNCCLLIFVSPARFILLNNLDGALSQGDSDSVMFSQGIFKNSNVNYSLYRPRCEQLPTFAPDAPAPSPVLLLYFQLFKINIAKLESRMLLLIALLKKMFE